MAQTKMCRDCRETLPLDSFQPAYKNPKGRQVYTTRCKPCLRKYRHPNAVLEEQGFRVCTDCKGTFSLLEGFPPAHTKKAQAKGQRKRRCHECWAKYRAHEYETSGKARYLKWQYGITLAERDAILASQGGACAICNRKEPDGHNWCIDHDHSCCPEKSKSCGKCIRGILCHSCNSAIGLLGDDPATIQAAAEYVANVSRRLSAQ